MKFLPPALMSSFATASWLFATASCRAEKPPKPVAKTSKSTKKRMC